MAVRAAEQMTPAMRERYGLDRNPWPLRIVAGLAVAGYAAILVFFATLITDQPIATSLLVWQQPQPQPDRLDITFDVNKPEGLSVTCALRAQDANRVDVGYATTELDAAPGYVQSTYSMRVLAPAQYVEVLGCGPQPLRVPPPAFPPGIAAPEQPWTAD